jgi:hypothetical protein
MALTGKIMKYKLTKTSSIYGLSEIIQDDEWILSDQLRLIYNALQLEDSETIFAHNFCFLADWKLGRVVMNLHRAYDMTENPSLHQAILLTTVKGMVIRMVLRLRCGGTGTPEEIAEMRQKLKQTKEMGSGAGAKIKQSIVSDP